MPINFFSINGAGAGGGSSTVNTANGISGDGSVGTPVILGGNPLNQTTDIALDDNVLQITDTVGPDQYFEQRVVTNYQNNLFSSLFQTSLQMNGNSGSGAGGYSISAAVVDIGGGGNAKEIQLIASTGSGIVVIDKIDNIGLLDVDLHPVSNPKQYAQYGNIGGFVASVNVPGGNATHTLSYVVGSTYEFLRLNFWAFFRSGGGSVALTVNYTDNGGTGRVISGGVLNLASPVQDANSFLIQAQAISTVQIVWTVTGVAVYDRIAVIEKLL